MPHPEPADRSAAALVDPSAAVVVPVTTNDAGQAHLALDLPTAIGAGIVHAQFLSIDAATANGAFSPSNGVRIQVR